MTLLESYARPRRLIEIFVLRLKGFQLIEQLKDQIAIILYQSEPAISSSKVSVVSGSGTRAPCRTRRPRPFRPLANGRDEQQRSAHRMFESHRRFEGFNTNAYEGIRGRATGAHRLWCRIMSRMATTMDCSSSRSSCSAGSGSGSKVAADQDLDSDRRFRISLARYHSEQ
jgi:hypothetical protein